MKPSTSVLALVGLAVLALVAHLWMLDAPTVAGPHHAPATETAMAHTAPAATMSGCSSGMSTCRVPLPLDSVLLLLLALAASRALRSDRQVPGISTDQMGTSVASAERAPPRPSVPPSVVLLV